LEKQTGVSVSVPIGNFTCVIYELDIWINNTLSSKDLVYVSGSTGIVQREYYTNNFFSNSFALYLWRREQLLKVQYAKGRFLSYITSTMIGTHIINFRSFP